jgi:hypothetical protein
MSARVRIKVRPTNPTVKIRFRPSGTNIDIATQAEAEAGASNTVAMTPLRTAQAIDVQVPALIPTTAYTLTLLDDANAGTARTTLGLGTAATQNTGTSGANVPLLNGANTFSAAQNVTADLTWDGAAGTVYTPTIVTTGTITTTTVNSARWKRFGKYVYVSGVLTVTNKGTASGVSMRISLPAGLAVQNVGMGSGYMTATGAMLSVSAGRDNANDMTIVTYDATLSLWGANGTFYYTCMYETSAT